MRPLRYIVLGLFLGFPAWAENPGNVSGIEIPGTPTLTPASPPPPKQDRAKSSAAAVAMAMAAASQQKMACYMMMSEAMKEKDKSTKAMMMAMAMQMCAQADQSMANAMKNKEGQKLVSAADIPKQAELKANPMTFGKSKVEEAEVPRITYLGENGEEDTGKDPFADLVTPLPEPNLAVFEPPPAQDDLLPPEDNVIEGPEEAVSALEPIERPSVKFDDAPKNAENGLDSGRGAFFASGSGQAPGTEGEGKGSASSEDSGSTTSSKRKRGGVRTASSGEGAGGGSSASEGSGKDYAAMLQQMLGGGAPGGDPRSGMPSTQGGDIVDLPDRDGEDLPNLFEYASFRYRKLAYEKGQLKLKRITQVRLPATATIAKASKAFTRTVKKLDTSGEP